MCSFLCLCTLWIPVIVTMGKDRTEHHSNQIILCLQIAWMKSSMIKLNTSWDSRELYEFKWSVSEALLVGFQIGGKQGEETQTALVIYLNLYIYRNHSYICYICLYTLQSLHSPPFWHVWCHVFYRGGLLDTLWQGWNCGHSSGCRSHCIRSRWSCRCRGGLYPGMMRIKHFDHQLEVLLPSRELSSSKLRWQ